MGAPRAPTPSGRHSDGGRGTAAAPSYRVAVHHRSVEESRARARQGAWAVIKRFVPSGVHHILIGPDHLLFLVGLLLLGGTIRQLTLVVTAFTIAHSITLSLAALNLVTPPPRIIEPAIALSIVYVGADNLLVRGGRDVRAWIAFAFGFIHGFGFANVLPYALFALLAGGRIYVAVAAGATSAVDIARR